MFAWGGPTSATLDGASSLTANLTLEAIADPVTLSGVGTITSTPRVESVATVSLSGTGALLGYPKSYKLRKRIWSYMPETFNSSAYMKDFIDTYDETVFSNVLDSLQRILERHDTGLVDRDYIFKQIDLIGLHVDISKFDPEVKRRILEFTPEFYKVSGSERFVDFLSWLVGVYFSISHLYSIDYITFDEKSTFDEDAGAYPTNHVALEYDLDKIRPGISQPTFDEVKTIFYQIASVELVLERLFGILRRDVTLFMGIITREEKRFLTTINTNDFEIDGYWGGEMMYEMQESFYYQLPNLQDEPDNPDVFLFDLSA